MNIIDAPRTSTSIIHMVKCLKCERWDVEKVSSFTYGVRGGAPETRNTVGRVLQNTTISHLFSLCSLLGYACLSCRIFQAYFMGYLVGDLPASYGWASNKRYVVCFPVYHTSILYCKYWILTRIYSTSSSIMHLITQFYQNYGYSAHQWVTLLVYCDSASGL